MKKISLFVFAVAALVLSGCSDQKSASQNTNVNSSAIKNNEQAGIKARMDKKSEPAKILEAGSDEDIKELESEINSLSDGDFGKDSLAGVEDE